MEMIKRATQMLNEDGYDDIKTFEELVHIPTSASSSVMSSISSPFVVSR